uniref:Uncharacterized protein n=1 Tax=Melopsittacus undulatus TaxID=13146 RepID=A0A8C6N7L4_MELUD
MSSRVDTELRETATDDQGSGPDLDLEISAEKAEQKSPSKKPQFVMPKISLSKIKVPKPQTRSPKVEADTTILKTERGGDDSIQIPDIERSNFERTEEGTHISIKPSDVKIPTLDFSKMETGASQTEMGVSSAKIGAALSPSEGSFQQLVLKSSSTNEDTIQKTGIEFPKGETSIELRSPEGWFKMPKFRIPAFGRTSLKGKKVTEITIGKEVIPKSGDSVKSSDVSLAKMEGDILLSTERADSTVNIPKPETYADIVKRSVEGQKMHTSELKVSPAEFDKDNSLTDRFSTLVKMDVKITRVDPEMKFQMEKKSIGLKSPALDSMEASARITEDKSQDDPEVNIKIPKLKIPRFTFKALPIEADVSVSKVVTDPKGSSSDIEVVQLQESSAIPEETPVALEGSVQKAKRQDIHWSYVEGQEVSEKVEPEHVAIERCEIYTTEIVKESEILSSEVKTPALGFSLLKVKLPESHSNLEVLVQQPSPADGVSVSTLKYADESFGGAARRTGSGITADPLSKDEDVAEALEDEEKDIINGKEKTDSKRSSGRFKFWLPSIGFSSSGDETSTDSKTEVKKSVPEEVKPVDTSDHDSSKQTEKTGWFRFPKLGFTSPSKKAKTVDKEEMDHGERRISDEDSPSDKPDVFFDAQESLSPKDITEGETVEADMFSSNVPVSRTIVTSSARTELILLEEEKGRQSNMPGDKTK